MGRKEDNIRKAQALMHTPKKIRNIGTAAHIDHGKCVSGDAIILFEGDWVRAADLYDRLRDRPAVRRTTEETVRDVRDLELNILALDREARAFVESPLTHAWKLKASEVLSRVVLPNSWSVATTPEHKFLTWQADQFLEVPAGRLRVGDLVTVRVPRSRSERLRMIARFPPPFSPPFPIRSAPRWPTSLIPSLSHTEQLLDQRSEPVKISDELWAMPVVSIDYRVEDWVYDFTVEAHHNFVAGGFVVHNTTMSDSLIAGAGMMSEELAGRQLLLDYDEQEQARGITINAANASMVHEYQGDQYLINLIDTPGHVDFGGDVTRAMRAIDGVIIVDDAVEGVMPQTETVIRQALKEKVKPTLFVNKVDRLINELQVGPDEMQQRLMKIITEVNARILKMVPEEFKDEWQVRVDDGTVAFGSALYTWAISVPYMERTGITFKDIYEYLKGEDQKNLAKVAPLHQVLLDMVIKHLPDPVTAQAYRIPHIWRGDIGSPIGKAMVNCDENGPVGLMITKIIMDPHAGEVAVGRLFSGKASRGQELHVIGMPKPYRVQQVALSVGADRIAVDEIDAGNVVSLTGIKDAMSGSTISSDPSMESFERIVHYSEPVVTVAIEAKHTKDLPRLVDVLRTIAKADPSIQVEIDQETGEHLMSGMGELHLEITQYRIVNEHKVEITASEPIVVYREMVTGSGGPFEGKSPNKHNRFYFEVSPLEEAVQEALKTGEIPFGRRIKNKNELARQLQEMGMPKVEAKGVVWMEGPNLLTNVTKGIQYLYETMDLIKDAYIETMNKGPLAQEKCMGVKVRLVDAKLHEDSIHRGPAQVIPAVRRAIYGAMCQAGRVLLEPKQKVVLNLPQDLMGAAIGELQSRRAEVGDITQEGETTVIHSKAPVAEMFGFATAIRSATQGRALWSYENAGFERLPSSLQPEVVRGIRTRKGLRPEPYDEAYYAA